MFSLWVAFMQPVTQKLNKSRHFVLSPMGQSEYSFYAILYSFPSSLFSTGQLCYCEQWLLPAEPQCYTESGVLMMGNKSPFDKRLGSTTEANRLKAGFVVDEARWVIATLPMQPASLSTCSVFTPPTRCCPTTEKMGTIRIREQARTRLLLLSEAIV